MNTLQRRSGFVPQLSGNALKIIAAVTMTVDHIGYIFYPQLPVLRYIGRLTLPVFAFMIAEGCHHTRSRLRYFLSVLALAVLCQSVYTVSMGDWFLCVPVAFSLAIPVVYSLQVWKDAVFREDHWGSVLWGMLFCGAVAAVYWFNRIFVVDYGFWGCMLPVAASLFRQKGNGPLRKMDCNVTHVMAMGVVMVLLALEKGSWQWWSILALPLLLLYSGKRGKRKMKYFFYIYYPVHLALLEGLAMLLYQS